MNNNKEELYVVMKASDFKATIQANMIQVVKDHIQPYNANKAKRIIAKIKGTSSERDHHRRPHRIKEVRIQQDVDNHKDYSDIEQYLVVKK